MNEFRKIEFDKEMKFLISIKKYKNIIKKNRRV